MAVGILHDELAEVLAVVHVDVNVALPALLDEVQVALYATRSSHSGYHRHGPIKEGWIYIHTVVFDLGDAQFVLYNKAVRQSNKINKTNKAS